MIIFESKYPNAYRQEEIKKILSFTQAGKFCQVVAAPGVGKATILKLLAHNRDLLKFHLHDDEKVARYIYLNLLELESLETEQVANLIQSTIDSKTNTATNSSSADLQKTINDLATQNYNTVLMFDHFDEYQNQLPNSFFELLKNIRSAAKYKFSVVFATRRDLQDLIDPEIVKKYYDFFLNNSVHLKINDKEATSLIISQTEDVIGKKLESDNRDKLIKITGGHPKLTKIATELVLEEESKPETEDLLSKQIIKAAADEIWQFLTAQEQEQLKKLTTKPDINDNSTLDNLRNFDLISQNSDFTIPLFEQYIKTVAPSAPALTIAYNPDTKEIKMGEKIISDLLSKQEYKMLKYLIEKPNQVVSREELISAVWPDAQVAEGISDEAIDQMVYRLRKKIETEPNSPKYLTTIKGQGWRFSA